ncbi:S41 family peptidase [Daejeonella sp.]|uniref:S41 family peptidase n=1 Tax=Daejeonella sp. TaxID=2805397 RepID=UPI0030BCAEE9
MKYLSLLIITVFLWSSQISYCQTNLTPVDYNLGIEGIDKSKAYPTGWFQWGKGYKITPDSIQKYSGRYSLLIQPAGEWENGQFGSPAVSIPAQYQGKEIELTGYLKLKDVQNGQAGLMLRIDGKEGTLQFDNMQQRKIQGTIDWTRYSVKLPLPAEATTIYVAALHTGTGQVWVDNLDLKIDGRELFWTPLKEAKVFKASLDHTFDKGSGIVLSNSRKNTIEDLTVLGKIWGFLKYYHPEVAAGNVNWDYELFRILPGVINSKTKEERNDHILSAINALGKLRPAGKEKEIKETDIKLRPDLKWVEDHELLGYALSKKLLEVEKAERRGDHYFITFEGGAGNPKFKNEDAYASMIAPDVGFRILALYRYWNMIQYYFPYKHLIGEDWNTILSEFLPIFIDAKDQRSYTFAALELIARIHDTHAGIWGNKYLHEIKGKSRLPFQAKFIEDKLTVTAFYSDTLKIREKVMIGDVISGINGRTVEDLIKEYLPHTPASNYPTQLRDLANDLLRTNDAEFHLDIIRDAKIMKLSLPSIDIKAVNSTIDYIPNPGKPGYYLLEDNIGYLFPAQYKNQDLPAIKKLFSSTKGIIVDMRCYPTEFMPFTFGQYIKSKSTPFVKFTVGDAGKPGLIKFGTSLRNGGGLSEAYTGKVVVIVNEQTQSSAEYTTMAFQSAPNVVVIGSTTAGADGNVSSITLPGGIQTKISGIGIYYPDGTETQRLGVKIDVPIKPTLIGIKSGRDELLEKARELILKDQGTR